MKRLIATVALIVTAISFAFAQEGTVTTKKYRLADFGEKVTKVVLTGNEITDAALMQAVVDSWTIAPFEFSDVQEYETLKTVDGYYFLIAAEGFVAKTNEPTGIVFLSVMKGGVTPEEIVSVPLCPTGVTGGRELVYIGAMVQTVQEFIEKARTSEKAAYSDLSVFNSNFDRKGYQKQLYIAKEDLADTVKEADLEKYSDADLYFRMDTEVDEIFESGAYNTLCSYSVSPEQPKKGDTCYYMLFEAGTGKLYYYQKHKISGREGSGISTADLKKISKGR